MTFLARKRLLSPALALTIAAVSLALVAGGWSVSGEELRLLAVVTLVALVIGLGVLVVIGVHIWRISRRLRGAAAELAGRVASHSRELDDANLIIKASSTILYRMGATQAFPLIYISPNIARFGLDADRLMADSHWAASMISALDHDRVVAAMRALLSSASASTVMEYRVRAPRGVTRWVENRCRVVRDERGCVAEIEGIVFDVTDRKQAQLALKDRESFTRAILDSISVEVAVLDRRGTIVAVNEQWRRFGELNEADQFGVSAHVGVGADYLAASRQSGADGEGGAAATGISDVLCDRRSNFSMVYACHAPQQARWFRMIVTPLAIPDGGVVVTHEDITHRKLAEEALRSSEQLLERTGRIAGIGGWKFDLTTRVVEWTAQTALIHELDPARTLTVEESLPFYAPQSRQALECALRQSLETGEGYDLELEMVSAKGRTIWVRTIAEVEFDEGVPARLTGTFQDITARRAMEGDLRRSNELLGTALETLPCGICVFDAAARLVAWNAEYLRLLQLPPELFDGGPPSLSDVVRHLAWHGEYGPCNIDDKVREVVDSVMKRPSQHFERIRPDGTTLEIRGAGMPEGGFIATFTDIGPRRRAEALAQQSTRLLGNAIEVIDEAFVLFGEDGRLTYCNEKYRALYGELSRVVVAGASIGDLARASEAAGLFVPSADEPGVPFDALSEFGHGPKVRLRRLRDGRILRSMERAMADGHTVGMLVDVTAHMRATETAQRALLAQGQFLANISHEIRTPMNAILGLLSLLHRTALNPRQQDYVARTDGAARALLGVLNAVLDFSKIESGAMQLDAHAFSMESLLRELSSIVSANMGKKALDLRFDIDSSLPPCLIGDALRLHQVLLNLLGNAIKFTEAGVVQLTMRVADRGDAHVTLTVQVSDDGIGIAPENLVRIFSGFTQAEGSTTRRFGGTGLGLAISAHLVDLMGGVLTVESALGAGSRFGFDIDLERPAPPVGELPEVACPTPRRAMMIADDILSGELSTRMMRSLGWTAEAFADGSDGLHLQQLALSARGYDVAFVDCPLTGSIGRELQAHPGMRVFLGLLPLIMMGTLEERERLWRQAGDDCGSREAFLVKPVTARMMVEAAERLLAGTSMSGMKARAAARLVGMNLLVVEDNATNQLVARELLQGEGASVQVANDGQRALDMLARARDTFDAVLMDLQMPVMDGLTATRRIRGELGLASLPIIAMTANASSADRLECLAAGMDEHVGKPFDLGALVALLRRLTGRPTDDSPRLPPAAGAPPMAAAVAEAIGVQLGDALSRLNGNVALYAQLLGSFVALSASTALDLQLKAQAGQWYAASRVLHASRGLAGTLGASRLASEAARAEIGILGPAGPTSRAAMVGQFCDLLTQARSDMSRLLSCLAAPDRVVPPVDPPAILGSLLIDLQRILGLLRKADMDTFEAVAVLRKRVGDSLGADFDAFLASVDDLDFESAAGLCDEFIARLTHH